MVIVDSFTHSEYIPIQFDTMGGMGRVPFRLFYET